MTTIIGVDFSGANENNGINTWVAQGWLENDGALTLTETRPIGRVALYEYLARVKLPAVVAMDFPFGVPRAFANHIFPPNAPLELMPQVWKAIHGIHFDYFVAARNKFVSAHNGEPGRVGDAYYPMAMSPLNLRMRPMTHSGVMLLHHLHQRFPNRWYVPPLERPEDFAARVTLLETMPGAFLGSVGLPNAGYKNGNGDNQRAERARQRGCIFDGLADAAGIHLNTPDNMKPMCVDNRGGDCLDAVIAAVGAAMWAQDCTRFRHPQPCELADAQLEGWIYAPLPA